MIFGGLVHESISYMSHAKVFFTDIKEQANGENIGVMEKTVCERKGRDGNEDKGGGKGKGRDN